MKRLIALLIATVLIVSMLGVTTVFAGNSISGKTEVLAGKSYTYKGSASYTCGDLVGKIEGLGKNASFKDGANGDGNESLSGNASITVTIPASAKPGDKYTITLSGQYSTMEGGVPVKRTDFSKKLTITVIAASASTPKPSSSASKKPSASTTTAKPKTTPKPTEWDIAEQKVALLQDEGSLSVDITKDPEIPSLVLTTLKEKKGSLTLNMGTYTCTIDGKTLKTLPKDSDEIDLSMKMEKDESFSAAVGGHDAYQLHFAHNGQLPGKFTYTFKAQDNAPGDTLYLYYYYDKSGVVEGMQSAVVDENGYVSFDIYHCSSYFVSKTAIEGAAGANFTSDDEHAAKLLELETANSELQEQLDSAEAQLNEVAAKLEELQQEENPLTQDPSMLGASIRGPVEKLFGVPYGALIAAMLGVALLTVLLTMLFCRAGVFKKRESSREDIL